MEDETPLGEELDGGNWEDDDLSNTGADSLTSADMGMDKDNGGCLIRDESDLWTPY